MPRKRRGGQRDLGMLTGGRLTKADPSRTLGTSPFLTCGGRTPPARSGLSRAGAGSRASAVSNGSSGSGSSEKGRVPRGSAGCRGASGRIAGRDPKSPPWREGWAGERKAAAGSKAGLWSRGRRLDRPCRGETKPRLHGPGPSVDRWFHRTRLLWQDRARGEPGAVEGPANRRPGGRPELRAEARLAALLREYAKVRRPLHRRRRARDPRLPNKRQWCQRGIHGL